MKKVGLFPLVGDLLHAGHLLALKEAKQYCDYLIVALNVNPDGKSPVETTYERFVRLEACKYVDEVIPYEGENDLLMINNTLNYNIRFIGSDHTVWTGKEIEEKRGIIYHQISRIEGVSSTDLKQRIRNAK